MESFLYHSSAVGLLQDQRQMQSAPIEESHRSWSHLQALEQKLLGHCHEAGRIVELESSRKVRKVADDSSLYLQIARVNGRSMVSS